MSVEADLIRRMSFTPDRRQMHTVEQLMVLAAPLLAHRPAGVLVEAGCYQGVSTARLSHLAEVLDTQLVVFDSFEGLPVHSERHRVTITGRPVRGWFLPGALAATLDEAQVTVKEHGVPERVDWMPGWFVDTMPGFNLPVAGAFLDVDLAGSTRTCLDHLWPLLTDRGVIVSQDGHLPLVVDEIHRWADTADPRPSQIEGLGVRQMVRISR